MTYCTDIGGDVRKHNNHHARALAARQALAGVGPCELPLSCAAQEELKSRNVEGAERLRLRMWSHFARSLDAQNFDLQKHPSWERYARAYLANAPAFGIAGDHDAEAVAAVAKEFGGVCADPRLGGGSSYWNCKS
jgi:hypothetical protein